METPSPSPSRPNLATASRSLSSKLPTVRPKVFPSSTEIHTKAFTKSQTLTQMTPVPAYPSSHGETPPITNEIKSQIAEPTTICGSSSLPDALANTSTSTIATPPLSGTESTISVEASKESSSAANKASLTAATSMTSTAATTIQSVWQSPLPRLPKPLLVFPKTIALHRSSASSSKSPWMQRTTSSQNPPSKEIADDAEGQVGEEVEERPEHVVADEPAALEANIPFRHSVMESRNQLQTQVSVAQTRTSADKRSSIPSISKRVEHSSLLREDEFGQKNGEVELAQLETRHEKHQHPQRDETDDQTQLYPLDDSLEIVETDFVDELDETESWDPRPIVPRSENYHRMVFAPRWNCLRSFIRDNTIFGDMNGER